MAKDLMFVLLCVVVFASKAESSERGSVLSRAEENTHSHLCTETEERFCTTNFMRNGTALNCLGKIVEIGLEGSIKLMCQSQQCRDQYTGRPGLAKEVQETSDMLWEKGIKLLKKIQERGSLINPRTSFTLQSHQDKCNNYGNVLISMRKIVRQFHLAIDKCYKIAKKQDGEFAFYLMKDMPEVTERQHQLDVHIGTVKRIETSGVGLTTFDSYLYH